MSWRDLARRVLVVIGLAGAAVTVVASPAPAQAPDQQGWWWLAGAAGITPPGVPEDGLYVAGNPSGAQGVSAVRFTLAGGGSAGTLRLDLAGSSSGTPVVGLCRVAASWKPVQGGSLGDAPTCAQGSPTVAGQPSTDGQSITFAVAELAADGVLDVAVVPGAGATFSAAFRKPAADALTAAGASSVADPPATDPAPSDAAPSPTFSAPEAFAGPAPAFEPLPPDAPLTGSAPRPAPVAPSGGVALGPTTPAGGGDDGGSGSLRILGFVVLAATAVAYHRLSTTPDRPPRSLVTFGQLAVEEQP